MHRLFVLIVLLVTVFRVGDFVDWQAASLYDKVRNDVEKPFEPAIDTCVESRGKAPILAGLDSLRCAFVDYSARFKEVASSKVQEYLPSPHSELVLGMVLGEDQFYKIPKYNDVLKQVGLVHVVVVSGYNISLVFTLLMCLLGSQYKIKNVIAGLIATLFYAGISGFGVPAVRAWVMGSIAVMFKFYGRPFAGLKILGFSALLLVLYSPSQLFSVSFQLSFLATLGVMVLPDILARFSALMGFKGGLLEDFQTSLSAQLMVNPLISYYFGTMSIVALISNPLVLWVVPVCTIVGGLLVISVFISPLLSHIIALGIYPFLDYFVIVTEMLSHFNHASLSIRFSMLGAALYYLVLFFAVFIFRKTFM